MTRDESPAARIIVTLPSGEEVAHLLPGGAGSIGRNSDNTVQVEDPRVSRYHARITPAGRTFIITDLGSRNGVAFRDELKDTITIAEHEPVSIGDSSFRLEWLTDPAEPDGAAGRLAWSPPAEPRAASATRTGLVSRALLAASGIGGLLAIAGSFLTWGEADIPIVGQVTRAGLDEDRSGPITIALGAAIALVALTAAWRAYLAPRAVANGLLAVALLVVAARDARELQDSSAFVERVTLGRAETSMGEGLLMVFVGGAATLLAALMLLLVLFLERRRAGP